MKKEQWDATAKAQVPTDEDEQVNQASALWARPKSEITEEQYHEFYKHVGARLRAAARLRPREGRRPPGVHAAALHPAARAVRPVGPRPSPRHQALRPARVHHGRRRAADAGVPALRARRHRLERPAAQRLARDPAAVARRRRRSARRRSSACSACSRTWRRTSRRSTRRSGTSSAACSRKASAEDPANRERIAKLLRFASTHDDSRRADGLARRLRRPHEGRAGRDLLHHRRQLRGGAQQPAPRDLPQARRRSAADVRPRRRVGRVDRCTEFDGKPLQSVAKGDLDLEQARRRGARSRSGAGRPASTRRCSSGCRQALDGSRQRRARDAPADRLAGVPGQRRARHEHATSSGMLKAAGQKVPASKPILEINPTHPIVQRLKDETDERAVRRLEPHPVRSGDARRRRAARGPGRRSSSGSTS